MSELILPLEVQLSGHFKLDAVRPDGRRRPLAPWQDNLLTDAGLYGLVGINYTNTNICHVGSGNAAPTIADTALQNWVAKNSSKVGDDFYDGSPFGARSTPPYYGWKRGTYRFAAGTATGNLSEIGLGASADGTNLFTRSLIKDTNGNPTSITVLADEMLDATYEVRMYPPLDDKVYVVNISGVDYTFTIRAAKVNSGDDWGYFVDHVALGHEFNGNFSPSTRNQFFFRDVTGLGPLTGTVQGVSSGGVLDKTTNFAPVQGALFRDFRVDVGTGEVTHANGVSGLEIHTTKGTYQMTVNPPIPKNGTNNLQLIFRVSWARYIP